MPESLADKRCVPCQGGTPPMKPEQFLPLLDQLSGWEVIQNHHLYKQYNFPDFVSALAFVNRMGAVAEAENHHPDIHLAWGKVAVQIYTHKIDGLSESDFVLAAKLDTLPH